MSTTINTKKRMRRRGQGMTEYIIIVGLIAILLVPAVSLFKNALSQAFAMSTSEINAKVGTQIGHP
jgi:Flp pilus assembly pilin Flp